MLSVENSYKDLNNDNSLVIKLLTRKQQENLFNIPALAYNEVSNIITEDMDSWDRVNYSNLIAEQVEYLINAVTDSSTGELTAPMIRYLHAASMVTFIRPGATINQVFLVLRRWDKRNEAIRYAKYSNCFAKAVIYSIILKNFMKEIKKVK